MPSGAGAYCSGRLLAALALYPAVNLLHVRLCYLLRGLSHNAVASGALGEVVLSIQRTQLATITQLAEQTTQAFHADRGIGAQ